MQSSVTVKIRYKDKVFLINFTTARSGLKPGTKDFLK